jgi:hypothetical protein
VIYGPDDKPIIPEFAKSVRTLTETYYRKSLLKALEKRFRFTDYWGPGFTTPGAIRSNGPTGRGSRFRWGSRYGSFGGRVKLRLRGQGSHQMTKEATMKKALLALGLAMASVTVPVTVAKAASHHHHKRHRASHGYGNSSMAPTGARASQGFME